MSAASSIDSASGYTLFATSLGTCGMAWTAGRVIAVQLPERTDALTIAHLLRRSPHLTRATPPLPPPIDQLVRGIAALFSGESIDFTGVASLLDLDDVPEFDRRVYAIAGTIRAGETMTYGDVADRLGDAGLSRAVGQALGRNPVPILVPCHRVVAADATGGFSAPGGSATKRRLLAIESAQGDLFDPPMPPAGGIR